MDKNITTFFLETTKLSILIGSEKKCLLFTAIISGSSIGCREVRFAIFFSGGFITAIVVNPLERKLAKLASVDRSCLSLFQTTVKSQGVKQAFIQFWTLFSKGHST